MTAAYECPGYDAAERASLNPPEERWPTTAQQNEIERRLEEMADDEISKAAQPFRDWIAESEHGPAIAIAATYWPGWDGDMRRASIFACGDKRDANVRAAIERMRADYIAYRVNTFTDDERVEVEREVMG